MSRTAFKRQLRQRMKAACERVDLTHGPGHQYLAHLGQDPPSAPLDVNAEDFKATWSSYPFTLDEAQPGDTINVAVYRGKLLGIVQFDAPEEMPEDGRGGRREGAGRPSQGRQHLTASLSAEDKAYVEKVGGESATEGVRELIAFHRQNA